MKEVFVTVAVLIGATIVAIALLFLGAWLDSGVTATNLIYKPEKVVECQPTNKGWSVCKTEWI